MTSSFQPSKKRPIQWSFFLLAASPGFEPRLTESESAVLPLDDEAILSAVCPCIAKSI